MLIFINSSLYFIIKILMMRKCCRVCTNNGITFEKINLKLNFIIIFYLEIENSVNKNKAVCKNNLKYWINLLNHLLNIILNKIRNLNKIELLFK